MKTMRNLYPYILTFVIISTAFYNQAQNSYFFNQRNIFTVNASYNPRLVFILRSNSFDANYYETSLGLGTYYQRYDKDDVLVGGHNKHNLMLNLAYGRIFNRNKVIGLEFNYQKHRMTINENPTSGYNNYYYEEDLEPYLVSTPVFNIYDIQFTYGLFNSNHLAPNKHNLMLNLAYGRIFNRNKVIGLEFNYQKHRMTINENPTSGYNNYYYEEDLEPYLVSTPVFNIYDIQFTYGLFNSNHLAPNQHLISYGVGVRIFSLDKKENYREDPSTPYTDLSYFLADYEKNFIFARLSLNYTYRILLSKNLSFDLGVNSNITLTTDFDPYDGDPSGYDFANNKKVAYSREYIKSRLGNYSFFNIFYFRTGLTFAI